MPDSHLLCALDLNDMMETNAAKTSPTSPVAPPFPKARKVSNARKQPVNSSEAAKSKPGVNRLIACQRCKTKKIKCDGNSPACSACARAKEECLISDMVTQRVYPRGYIDQLEAKVNELQQILGRRPSQNDDVVFSSNTISPRKSATSSSYPSISPTSIDSQSPGMGPENPSSISLARLILAAIPFKSATVSLTSLEEAMSKTELKVVDYSNSPPKALPSREHAHDLLNHYLETEQQLLPFMPHEMTLRRIDRIYEVKQTDEHGGDYSLDPVTSQDMFRAFMLFALFSASSSTSLKELTDSRGYYQSAMQYVDDAPQLHGMEAIQIFQLVALYSLYQHIGITLWDATRQCLKICIQEGYHLKPFYDTPFKAENMQRRVFWTSYCMDIFFSRLVLGRPVAIAEGDITVDLVEDAPEMSNLLDLVKFCRFISEVSHFFIMPSLDAIPSQFNIFMKELVRIRLSLGQTNKAKWHDFCFYLVSLNMCRWSVSTVHSRVDKLPVDLLWLCLNSALNTIKAGVDIWSPYGFTSTKMHFNIGFQAAITALHCLLVPAGPAIGVQITHAFHPIEPDMPRGDILDRVTLSVHACFDHLNKIAQNLDSMNGYIQALEIVFRHVTKIDKPGLVALQKFQAGEFQDLKQPQAHHFQNPMPQMVDYPTGAVPFKPVPYNSYATPNMEWSAVPRPLSTNASTQSLDALQTFDPNFAPDFTGFGAAAEDFMKMWTQLDPAAGSSSASTQDPLSLSYDRQVFFPNDISPMTMDLGYMENVSNYRWF